MLRAIACWEQERLFVVLIGDVIFKLNEASTSRGCEILLLFVEFSNSLTPLFRYGPVVSISLSEKWYQCFRMTVRILRFVAKCRFAVREISGLGLNALLTCKIAVV